MPRTSAGNGTFCIVPTTCSRETFCCAKFSNARSYTARSSMSLSGKRGKTTTIGILTTRVRATAGDAFVAGQSVSAAPTAVRHRIGVVPQRPNPDRGLSVIENLIFHAAYFGVSRAEAMRRSLELLERLG